MGTRLANKVAIVTGSGRGIGRVMAEQFAAEAASVVVADICDANAAAAAIAAAGGSVLAVSMDVTEPAAVAALIEQTVARFGRIDILVNNAGVGLNQPFLETTPEQWDRVLGVNLTGTFLCAQAAARRMVQQGAGRIVNIASVSGQRGAQGRSAYGASKAGVILLTKVMAVELAPLGIAVNAVAPGPVATPMTSRTHNGAIRNSYHNRIPMCRYGTEPEIAAAALFLASDEAGFVNGHVLNVDGGFCAAGLMFDSREDGEASKPVVPAGVRPCQGDAR